MLEELERRIAAAVHPLDDLRGSAAYKRQIAAVLGARALQTAVHRFLSAEGAR